MLLIDRDILSITSKTANSVEWFFSESILVTKVQIVYVKVFVDLIKNYFLKYFRQGW